ncbi:MAG: iron chelate uptake ABC transporter family permease subunit, partial [Thioalkalispiraceae bacterium]
MHNKSFLSLLLVLSGLSILLSLMLGSTTLAPATIWNALSQAEHDTTRLIITELRLPRVLSGFAVGALLALAGTLMQVLIRNPLADPYILGISGGASVAALLTMLAGLGGLWLS